MSQKETTRRNGKIELMRFICALAVVLFHFRKGGNTGYLFRSGALAVEFFFILSGYLMMNSIDRVQNTIGDAGDLGVETFRFLRKKVVVLYPEVLIAFVFGFTLRCITRINSFTDGVWYFVSSFWEALLLRHTGLQVKDVNPVTWYLSAMLIAMAVLYPLLRKYRKMMTHVVLPLASLLVLGWLCQNYKTPRSPDGWTGWAFRGTLRAFGEIGVGVTCYQVTKAFSKLRLTKAGQVAVTCLEPILYGMFIIYMCRFYSSQNDWAVIPLLALAICITFSGHTLTHRMLDNRFVIFLGKISLPLYLGHHYWAYCLQFIFPKHMPWQQQFVIYAVAAALTTAVIYALSTLFRRYHIGQKIAGLFVRREEAASE